MIDDWRMAEALAIERWKGSEAAAFIAQRLTTLALAGDQAGVERFRAIAVKFDELQRGPLH